ncbi:retrovirus-related pol polyprotein from transposon TNT 1-94 [Tanacetum coccineum]
MLKTSPICLLSKSSKTKSWLWHRLLSHLNFGTLNQLAKDGLAQGISKLKFKKDHLCSACALGKSKKSSHQPKAKDTNQEKLYLMHMDLCGLMRVEIINEKNYILVIPMVAAAGSRQVKIHSHMLILDRHIDEVLKLKNFNKDENTSFQEQKKYEHVGPKVTSTQDGKRSQDDDMRLCSADDLNELKDRMQVKLKGTSSSLKSKDHYAYHKLKDKDSRPRAKTEDIRRMLKNYAEAMTHPKPALHPIDVENYDASHSDDEDEAEKDVAASYRIE